MCFSATASFTAGAALTAVGGFTVHKSQGKIELPLALVPLLFGIQQLTEGVLWPGGRCSRRSAQSHAVPRVFGP